MDFVCEDIASEIAEDFASDYLKDYERMSDNDLSKLREDLKAPGLKLEKRIKLMIVKSFQLKRIWSNYTYKIKIRSFFSQLIKDCQEPTDVVFITVHYRKQKTIDKKSNQVTKTAYHWL